MLDVEPEIVCALASGDRLVLTAPTGSGKTTQVPQILLRSGLIDGQIIVLQPRRLATRLVAQRVAREMGCEVGSLVGFQTRHESVVSRGTRIRFMTEGLLLRLLQADPSLKDVGAIVIDEFHERNLAADLSLGLVRRMQDAGRRGLKLLMMSATLDVDAVAGFLKAPIVRAGGRLHPVDVTHLARTSQSPPWELAAEALREEVAAGSPGDALVFMPGVYEINRTIECCRALESGLPEPLAIVPLHGSLDPREQDAALAPAKTRKVIVSTNVAETSITIEGVRIVIDSGLARVHRYEPSRAMNMLRLEPISRASAEQRAGRAGRTAPGRCRRLWTQREHLARPEHDLPEVRRLDLAEGALQLQSMGVSDLDAFPWLDAPSPESLRLAIDLLRRLDAVDDAGRITERGRTMAEFPVHPRLSRMLIEARSRGCLGRALVWAALIGERDVMSEPRQRRLLDLLEKGEPPSDLAARERVLEQVKASGFSFRRADDLGANAAACRDADRAVSSLRSACRRAGWAKDAESPGATGDIIKSLLIGFDDHIAMRLDAQRPHCAMAGRRKVVLDRESVVREAGLLLALDVRELRQSNDTQTNLSMASRVEPQWLEEVLPQLLTHQSETVWNAETLAVEQVARRVFNGLAIDQTIRPDAPSDAAAEILVEQIAIGALKLEHWNDAVTQWIERARCVAAWLPERGLIKYDDDDLRVILHEIVQGATRFNQVRGRPCLEAVKGALSWEDQRLVETMAPELILLPRGWRMRIEYQAGSPPRGRAKIQDLYGLDDTPRIGGGRIPLLLEILGPNFRPVQVTGDLRGFWQTLYPELKKELKRRYPRHEWR